jgi:PAS domain S-box-containing protein
VPITFYEAYIEEGPEVENDSYRQSVAAAFRRRYAGKHLDLVITDGPQALDFAEHYRDQIFPGVPIVFTAVSTAELDDNKRWPGSTGVADLPNIRETIDLALHLQPDIKAFAVISGLSEWDRFWLAAVHSELLRYQDKVKEIDLVGPPSAELLKRVAALPPHTVTLFQIFPQDSSQSTVGLFDVLPAIAQYLPTYCAFPGLCLGHGGVGGVYHDASTQLALTEEMAAQVLLGKRPEDIPVARQSDLQVRVDWRALERWYIPESALPPGTLVLYREPTLWERDRKYILAVIVVIIVQVLLIVGLLWQRARKRKAEAVLRESEKRFQVMADTTPSLIWMCDAQGRITYLNERRISFTGPDPNAGYGDTWAAYVHPEDVKNVLDTVAQALETRQPFSKEYRLRRSDGVYRWMFDLASPRVNGDGSFAGFIGSAIDVTDQKLAREALERVGGQLIAAQENHSPSSELFRKPCTMR